MNEPIFNIPRLIAVIVLFGAVALAAYLMRTLSTQAFWVLVAVAFPLLGLGIWREHVREKIEERENLRAASEQATEAAPGSIRVEGVASAEQTVPAQEILPPTRK